VQHVAPTALQPRITRVSTDLQLARHGGVESNHEEEKEPENENEKQKEKGAREIKASMEHDINATDDPETSPDEHADIVPVQAQVHAPSPLKPTSSSNVNVGEPSPSTMSTAVEQALMSPPPVPPSPSVSPPPSSAGENDAASSSMSHLRDRAESELLSTEESYVSSLGILVEQYIHPMRRQTEELGVTHAQVSATFSNVELLYNFHVIFLADLRKAVETSRKHAAVATTGTNGDGGDTVVPASDSGGAATPVDSNLSVAQVILKCCDFMKMTTQFVAAYPTALQTLAQLRSNTKLQSFLDERKKVTGAGAGLDLLSFLIAPVQRIPRYLLLLKVLLRYTPRSHPQRETLQEAYTKVQSVALHINEQQRQVENMSALLRIQNGMTSSSSSSSDLDVLGPGGQLMQPHRRLIRSGILQKRTSNRLVSQHARKVYLFNDLLLWCECSDASSATDASSTSSSSSNGEKFSNCIRLYPTTQVGDHFEKNGRTGFRIVPFMPAAASLSSPSSASPSESSGKSSKPIIFLCSSSDEKRAWVEDLHRVLEALETQEQEASQRRMARSGHHNHHHHTPTSSISLSGNNTLIPPSTPSSSSSSGMGHVRARSTAASSSSMGGSHTTTESDLGPSQHHPHQ